MGLSYEIHYKNGVENTAADVLSRAYTEANCSVISQVQPKWIEEILTSYERDQEIVQLLTQLHLDTAVVVDDTIQNGFLRFKGKIWVGNGSGLRQQLVQQIHTFGLGGHSGVSASLKRIKLLFY